MYVRMYKSKHFPGRLSIWGTKKNSRIGLRVNAGNTKRKKINIIVSLENSFSGKISSCYYYNKTSAHFSEIITGVNGI